MSRLSLKALPLIIGLSFALPAFAANQTAASNYEQADVVFTGVVESTSLSSDLATTYATIHVTQTWKGSVSDTITVYNVLGAGECATDFLQNQEYLFYGSRDPNGIFVSICSGMKLRSQAADDIAYLDSISDSSASSYAPNCAPYICADGTQVPRCSENGTVINYFAAPCLTHGGEVSSSSSVQSFSDVSSDYPYADAINYLHTQAIVSGYSDGTFRPDATINRAEFTKIIIGAYFSQSQIQSEIQWCSVSILHFSDTEIASWYSPYLCVALQHNIINGYSDDTFRPAATINFAEAAKILVKSSGLEASSTIPACQGDCPWYRPYILMLEMQNAIPTSIQSFDQPITRGEMAEMIYRLKANVTNKPSMTYEELASDNATMSIILYFGDTQQIETSDCSAVKPVTRSIPKTSTVADAALRLLFAGVTSDEKAQGLSSTFDNQSGYFGQGVEPLLNYYQGVSIVNGVATVKFTGGAMAYLNNTACTQQEVKGSIEATLKQFSSVQKVQYSVDGKIVTQWDA